MWCFKFIFMLELLGAMDKQTKTLYIYYKKINRLHNARCKLHPHTYILLSPEYFQIQDKIL